MGRGPENGADSDIVSTPNLNLWGVLHLTFLKNRRGKPFDTGFEIIRPRRPQRRVATVPPPTFQKTTLLEKASSTNSDALPVQVVKSEVTDISVSLVQTRFLLHF